VPWQRVNVDSVWRAGLGGPSAGPARHETSPEGISARYSPSGVLHAVYGTSQNHGLNVSTAPDDPPNSHIQVPNYFNAFIYVRRDAMGNTQYITLKANDKTPEYRNSSAMALKGEDSLYIVYAERH